MSSFEFTGGDIWCGRAVARKVCEVEPRSRLVVTGTICGAEVIEVGGSRSGSYLLDDGTGTVDLVFLGRPRVQDLSCGTRCTIEGTARLDHGGLVVWNPLYRIEAPS